MATKFFELIINKYPVIILTLLILVLGVFVKSQFFIAEAYEINLIGFVDDIKSTSRHTSSFIECLYPESEIKIFKTRACVLNSDSLWYSTLIDQSIDLENPTVIHAMSGITIYTHGDSQWGSWDNYIKYPNSSTITFAYGVHETSLVPQARIAMINANFDALIVPDQWLVNVYKNSGLEIPIFVLPEALNLTTLLNHQSKQSSHQPFTFGFSGCFWPRKNHTLLIQAFVEEFGADPNIVLKLHARKEEGFEEFFQVFERMKTPNITLEQRALDRDEYEQFLISLDCYVSISKSEGFSIIPREALAAGIPCIVSDNSAQSTICKSGCVYSVPSEILEQCSSMYNREAIGYISDCTVEDVRRALRAVYENYDHYLLLAQRGRVWVKQYLPENLKLQYRMLTHPSHVILGDRNEIADEYLMTDSPKLFEKYSLLKRI